jgi:predicted aspartyl protease
MPLQIDTGAAVTVLTPRLARSLGVHVTPLRRHPYRRATALGRDLLFRVDTRRSDTASTAAFEYSVVGGDFLAQYVVELDFRRRRVRFLNPDRFEVPEQVASPDEAVLPLELVSNRPGIRASVNGREFLFLIDTGAPMGLMLSGDFALTAGVPSAPVAGFAMQGVRGGVASEMGIADRLGIGPFAFSEVATAVAPNGFFNLGYPGDSILGFDLLAQFLVRIDYPRRESARSDRVRRFGRRPER